MSDNCLMQIKDVTLHLKNQDHPILNNINLSINKGDFIILLGSNGSGKSSLIKLINGTLPLTKGKIIYKNEAVSKIKNLDEIPCQARDEKTMSSLNDKTMSSLNDKTMSSRNSRSEYPGSNLKQEIKLSEIVTLTQNVNDSLFEELTVFENCKLYHMKNKTKNSKNIFNLDFFSNCKYNKVNGTDKTLKNYFKEYLVSFNKKLSFKLNEKILNLSGGEKQALILALCLYVKPKLLLLDEHTSALDPKLSKNIIEKTAHEIKKQNITCIMTTHDLSIASNYGNKIIGLNNGQIIKTIDTKNNKVNANNIKLNNCNSNYDDISYVKDCFGSNDLLSLYD